MPAPFRELADSGAFVTRISLSMRLLLVRRRLLRARCLGSRSRTLALLLPRIELGLLVLLVLWILLHRRSWFHQRMCVLHRGRTRHRASCRTRRLRLTRDIRWCRRVLVVRRRLCMRRLAGRGLLRSWCRLSRSGWFIRRSSCGLWLSRSLRPYVGRRRLSLFERSTRSGRLFDCHHLPVHYRGRRLHGCGPTGSHDTCARRLCRNVVDHGSALDLLLIYLYHARRHRTRVHKSLVGNRCDRVVHVLIGVINPSHIRGVVVDDRGVVNIGHLGDVHISIRDVHIVHVAWAGSIPGHENFARSQREPGHANANADSQAEAASAHKCDQRGCINRAYVHWPWHPAPGTFHKCPASIVERSEAPRLIFNPSPAPGSDPNPVAEPVGSPTWGDARRSPHRTITCRIMPLTVLVEVGGARHV